MLNSRTFNSVNLIGAVLVLGTFVLTAYSSEFAYESDFRNSPIVAGVCLLVFMSLLSLAALWKAVSSAQLRIGWKTVVSFAVTMRLIALFSTPILEIDYYRYLWDGETVNAGVSPYDYSPKQVLEVPSDDVSLPEDLQKLAVVRDQVTRNQVILSRIHYEELPSIYPPVSQAVFATAALTIPDAASVEQAIVILKAWIVLFDIGVVLLLCKLLLYLNLKVGWAIGYAWSPLVIKEFANSGHLDAIAVFFSVLAVWFFVSGLFPALERKTNQEWKPSLPRLIFAAVALGLSIGAKLYPVIFVPLFFLTIFRKQGVRQAALFGSALCVVTMISCWPQLGPKLLSNEVAKQSKPMKRRIEQTQFVQFDTEVPPLPPMSDSANESSKSSYEIKEQNLSKQPEQKSLKVFLTQWKMNDLLFHFVESNLTPNKEATKPIWFVILPASFRDSFVNAIGDYTKLEKDFAPFFVTRFSFALLFFCLAMWWAWKASTAESAIDWLHAVFLTLAWFWILLPTLNPWYWIWAMPFLAFSRRKTWHLVAVLVLLYYLRFWLQYNWDGIEVMGTPYQSEQFFHHVFVWFEHLPWMLLLLWETVASKPVDLCNGSQTDFEGIG